MKTTIIIAILTASSFLSFSQEQKHYRIVEYFKSEERMIYFNWSTDSAKTAAALKVTVGEGAVLKMETKIMTPKKARKENEANERRKRRDNYPHIKDLN